MGGVGPYQAGPGHNYYSPEALARGMQLYNKELLEICHAREVECIDAESKLAKDTTSFYDDAHFNERGSEKLATILADYFNMPL